MHGNNRASRSRSGSRGDAALPKISDPEQDDRGAGSDDPRASSQHSHRHRRRLTKGRARDLRDHGGSSPGHDRTMSAPAVGASSGLGATHPSALPRLHTAGAGPGGGAKRHGTGSVWGAAELEYPATYLPQSFQSKVLTDTLLAEMNAKSELRTAVFPKLLAGCPVMSLIEPESAGPDHAPFSPAVAIGLDGDDIVVDSWQAWGDAASNADSKPGTGVPRRQQLQQLEDQPEAHHKPDLSDVIIGSPAKVRVRLSDYRSKRQSIREIFKKTKRKRKKKKKAKQQHAQQQGQADQESLNGEDNDIGASELGEASSRQIFHLDPVRETESPRREGDGTSETNVASPGHGAAPELHEIADAGGGDDDQDAQEDQYHGTATNKHKNGRLRKKSRQPHASGGWKPTSIRRDHPYRKPYMYGLEWQRKNFSKIVVPRAHSVERTHLVGFDVDSRGVTIENREPADVKAFPKVERALTGAEKRMLRQQRIAARRALRRASAVKIQGLVRGVQERRRLQLQRGAIVLQCWARKFQAVRRVMLLQEEQRRRHAAALAIQQQARSRQARKKTQQRRARAKARREFAAASRIQSFARGRRDRGYVTHLLVDSDLEVAAGPAGGQSPFPLLLARYADPVAHEKAVRLRDAEAAEAERLQSYHKLSMLRRLRLDMIEFLGVVAKHVRGGGSSRGLLPTLHWDDIVSRLHSGFVIDALKPPPPRPRATSAGASRLRQTKSAQQLFSDDEGGDSDGGTDDDSSTLLGAPELLKILRFLESKQIDASGSQGSARSSSVENYCSGLLPGLSADVALRTNAVHVPPPNMPDGTVMSASPVVAAAAHVIAVAEKAALDDADDASDVKTEVVDVSSSPGWFFTTKPKMLGRHVVDFSRLVDGLTVELVLMDAFHRCAQPLSSQPGAPVCTLAQAIGALQAWRDDDKSLCGQKPAFDELLNYIPRPREWFEKRSSECRSELREATDVAAEGAESTPATAADGAEGLCLASNRAVDTAQAESADQNIASAQERSASSRLLDCTAWCRLVNYDPLRGALAFKQGIVHVLSVPVPQFTHAFGRSPALLGQQHRQESGGTGTGIGLDIAPMQKGTRDDDDVLDEDAKLRRQRIGMHEAQYRLRSLAGPLMWSFPAQTSIISTVSALPQALSSAQSQRAFFETPAHDTHDEPEMRAEVARVAESFWPEDFFDSHGGQLRWGHGDSRRLGAVAQAVSDEYKLHCIFERAAHAENAQTYRGCKALSVKGATLARFLGGWQGLVRRSCSNAACDVLAHLSAQGGHGAEHRYSLSEFIRLCNRPTHGLVRCLKELQKSLDHVLKPSQVEGGKNRSSHEQVVLEIDENLALKIAKRVVDHSGPQFNRLYLGKSPVFLADVLQEALQEIAAATPSAANRNQKSVNQEAVLLRLWRCVHLHRVHDEADHMQNHGSVSGAQLHASLLSSPGLAAHFKSNARHALSQLARGNASMQQFNASEFASHLCKAANLQAANDGAGGDGENNASWQHAEAALRLHRARVAISNSPSPLGEVFPSFPIRLRRVLFDKSRSERPKIPAKVAMNPESPDETTTPSEETETQDKGFDDIEVPANCFVWFVARQLERWAGPVALSEVTDSAGRHMGVRVTGRMSFEPSVRTSDISYTTLNLLVRSRVASSHHLWWRVAHLRAPAGTKYGTLQAWQQVAGATVAQTWFAGLAKRVLVHETLQRRRAYKIGRNLKALLHTASPLVSTSALYSDAAKRLSGAMLWSQRVATAPLGIQSEVYRRAALNIARRYGARSRQLLCEPAESVQGSKLEQRIALQRRKLAARREVLSKELRTRQQAAGIKETAAAATQRAHTSGTGTLSPDAFAACVVQRAWRRSHRPGRALVLDRFADLAQELAAEKRHLPAPKLLKELLQADSVERLSNLLDPLDDKALQPLNATFLQPRVFLLGYAAHHNAARCGAYLLRRGLKAGVQNTFGSNFLHFAAAANAHRFLAEVLGATGEDNRSQRADTLPMAANDVLVPASVVNCANREGVTPVGVALSLTNLEAAEVLLGNKMFDPQVPPCTGLTLLMAAVVYGPVEALDAVLHFVHETQLAPMARSTPSSTARGRRGGSQYSVSGRGNVTALQFVLGRPLHEQFAFVERLVLDAGCAPDSSVGEQLFVLHGETDEVAERLATLGFEFDDATLSPDVHVGSRVAVFESFEACEDDLVERLGVVVAVDLAAQTADVQMDSTTNVEKHSLDFVVVLQDDDDNATEGSLTSGYAPLQAGEVVLVFKNSKMEMDDAQTGNFLHYNDLPPNSNRPHTCTVEFTNGGVNTLVSVDLVVRTDEAIEMLDEDEMGDEEAAPEAGDRVIVFPTTEFDEAKARMGILEEYVNDDNARVKFLDDGSQKVVSTDLLIAASDEDAAPDEDLASEPEQAAGTPFIDPDEDVFAVGDKVLAFSDASLDEATMRVATVLNVVTADRSTIADDAHAQNSLQQCEIEYGDDKSVAILPAAFLLKPEADDDIVVEPVTRRDRTNSALAAAGTAEEDSDDATSQATEEENFNAGDAVFVFEDHTFDEATMRLASVVKWQGTILDATQNALAENPSGDSLDRMVEVQMADDDSLHTVSAELLMAVSDAVDPNQLQQLSVIENDAQDIDAEVDAVEGTLVAVFDDVAHMEDDDPRRDGHIRRLLGDGEHVEVTFDLGDKEQPYVEVVELTRCVPLEDDDESANDTEDGDVIDVGSNVNVFAADDPHQQDLTRIRDGVVTRLLLADGIDESDTQAEFERAEVQYDDDSTLEIVDISQLALSDAQVKVGSQVAVFAEDDVEQVDEERMREATVVSILSEEELEVQ